MSRVPLFVACSSAVWLAACSCQPENVLEPIPEDDPLGIGDHDIGQYLSVAATEDGKPAISFYDKEKGAVAYAVGTPKGEEIDWHFYPVDGYPDDVGLDPGDRGKYTSLGIAEDGRVWIAYYDVTAGTLRIAHCKKGEKSWTLMSGDVGSGATPDTGRFASLALDPDGNPVVAHYQADKQILRVTRYNGSAFSGETVDEGTDFVPEDTGTAAAEANVGKYANLAIGEDGTEYIAYYDAAHGDLKLATGTAGNYTITTVDSEGDVGAWPDILLDGDELFITYQDVGEQDLKLARGAGAAWVTETLDAGDYVGADSAIFLNGSFPAAFYFDGHDNNAKLAQMVGDSWTTETFAGEEAAVGYHLETVTIGSTVYVGSYDYTNRTLWWSSL